MSRFANPLTFLPKDATMSQMNELSLRHREILRLAFSGMTSKDIGAQMGLSHYAVRAVLRSELAQAELARMSERAEEVLTNTPLKVRLIHELTNAASDAVRINHDLLRNEQIDPRVRSRIGQHFIDRVIFDRQENVNEGGYREILRSLDRLEKKVDSVPANGEVVDRPLESSDASPRAD